RGTELLLLALNRLDDDKTAAILKRLSLSTEKVRDQVIEVLKTSTGYDVQKGEQTPSRRFDTFTKRAQRVIQLAQEEAQRFNHNYIGTEHILLGLVREEGGVA